MACPKPHLQQLWFVLAVFLLAVPTLAADKQPAWWSDLQREADRYGYALIDDAGLTALGEPGNDYLLIDVRPGYEFEAGHMPGALHLEFNLGEEHGLSEDKRTQLTRILDTYPQGPVVLACRSFR